MFHVLENPNQIGNQVQIIFQTVGTKFELIK